MGVSVLIFAQGTVGLADIFLHPAYTSSVTPFSLDPGGLALLVIVVCTLLFSWAVYMYFYYRDKRSHAEMLDTLNRGPP